MRMKRIFVVVLLLAALLAPSAVQAKGIDVGVRSQSSLPATCQSQTLKPSSS